jgi:hypothetical protein
LYDAVVDTGSGEAIGRVVDDGIEVSREDNTFAAGDCGFDKG